MSLTTDLMISFHYCCRTDGESGVWRDFRKSPKVKGVKSYHHISKSRKTFNRIQHEYHVKKTVKKPDKGNKKKARLSTAFESKGKAKPVAGASA